MDLITKSGCMSVTGLNHAVRHLCHVIDVCSNLLKDLHDSIVSLTCLIKTSWEMFLVVFG